MRTLKHTFLFLLLTLFCCSTAFGQKANKMAEKRNTQATEKVEKLNSQIIAGDASAALTTEQFTSIKDTYLELMKQIQAIRKEGGTKEEQQEQMKAIRKAANQKINQELLTKEQRRAKKAGKE